MPNAIDWLFRSFPPRHTHTLTPKVVILGGGGLWGRLSKKGGMPMNGICTFIKRSLGAPSPLLPHEDTEKKTPFMNQEAGSHQILNINSAGVLILGFPAS